ncbi:Cd2+/Zn2+-exporting ATPase [Luteibacter sp. W1I16]|uniref:heavy metal translocating P-type ATPase n=1 Tax=Luteibacter sp. W1I16 TaxID=3373922 RepID=UPI003D207BED
MNATPPYSGAMLLTGTERHRWRFRIVAVLLAGGLLAFSFALLAFTPRSTVEATILQAIAALLVAGPAFASAARSLHQPDLHGVVDQLVALAILACLVSANFVTATLLPVIMLAGQMLEDRSLLGTREAVEALVALTSSTARILRDDRVETLPAEQLVADDIIEIRPGDRVPADGVVVKGMGSMDTASLTGESLPVEVAVGDAVLGSSLNLNGLLHVRVSRVGSESALGRVVALMQDAERSKPPITRLLERFAGRYLVLVLLVALMLWFTTQNTGAVLALLVAACPSAMVLAAPSTALAAVSVAARHGILVKSSVVFERLAEADALVVDKTGTVTTGRLRVVRFEPAHGADIGRLEAVATALGAASTHPVGRAIAQWPASPATLSDIQEDAGFGMRATGAFGPVFLGRESLLAQHSIAVERPPEHDGPVAAVAEAGRLLGWVCLSDEMRGGVTETLTALHELGLHRQALLTGDRQAEANRVAAIVGLKEVVPEALPPDKLAFVQSVLGAGGKPLVVGDGINDALALRAGLVGMAMGGQGSDIALASADIVLTGGDFSRIATAVRLARRTRRTLRVNLALSAAWTLALVVVAVSGGWAASGALAAAVLQNIGAFVVIANAGRLMKFNEN